MTIDQALKILRIHKSSSFDEIKNSYRRLAMTHHPDRGGDEETFKIIKEAYEVAEAHFQKIDLLAPLSRSIVKNINVDLTLEEAFSGLEKIVTVSTNPKIEFPVTIIPGCANGEFLATHTVKGIHKVNSVDELLTFIYNFYARILTDYIVEWGDVERDKRGDVKRDEIVSPFKMILGGWHDVITLSGKTVSIRIPEGLATNSILKVKGHGYWKNSILSEQGDLYLRVIPDIKKLQEYTESDLKNFLNEIRKVRSEWLQLK